MYPYYVLFVYLALILMCYISLISLCSLELLIVWRINKHYYYYYYYYYYFHAIPVWQDSLFNKGCKCTKVYFSFTEVAHCRKAPDFKKQVGTESTLHIYLEYHSVCPLVGIGTFHPLSRKRVSPCPRNQEGGGHTGLQVREFLFRRLEKKPSTLSILCVRRCACGKENRIVVI
jgi:hypothetical protein